MELRETWEGLGVLVWYSGVESTRGRKLLEQKGHISETNPTEWYPRAMQCRVDMGRSGEETKPPQPPRNPPMLVLSGAQDLSTIYRCQW